MCVWQSMNPGTRRRHFASTTVVDGPASFEISASEPTATIRPPRTASASASGRAGSPVQIFSDLTIISGGAGTAKTTLYKLFGSKTSLVHAVLESEGRQWREWFIGAIEAGGGDAQTKLMRIFPALKTWFGEDRFYGCPFINAVAEHDKDQKQFWPGNIKTYTREGKVWGLPVVAKSALVSRTMPNLVDRVDTKYQRDARRELSQKVVPRGPQLSRTVFGWSADTL